MKDPVEKFIHDCNIRIDAMLKEKLRLLGITIQDVKEDKASLNLKKIQRQEGNTLIEEFSAKGIRLFTVIWSEATCILKETDIDETEMDTR
jgi:hypothetical protein